MISFHDLYQRYAADVYRFAYALCGRAADAEDLTSETFVRAWTSADTLRAPTVKAYLLTITRHLYLRSRARGSRQTELPPDLLDPAPGPQHLAEVRTELAATLAALQNLPEAERTALILRAQENLSYEEIALALKISVAAAKVHVHRARKKLARLRDARETP